MAIKPIIQIGNPKLKAKNKSILKSDTAKVAAVIRDLTDTMLKNDIIGIAAPQIGINLKLFIT
jgi:peptide deformylase